ncbi:MAG TPA: hypothetical protein VI381_08115 [Allosphingosinicella sp.]
MRRILFAATLLIGGAAFAQDAQPTETKTENTQHAQGMHAHPEAAKESNMKAAHKPAHKPTHKSAEKATHKPAASGAGEGITAEGTRPEGVAIAPPGTNVLATPAPGAGVMVSPDQGAMFATRPATEDYPRCSRNVTDNCLQRGPR